MTNNQPVLSDLTAKLRAQAMPQITEQGSVARGIVLGMLDLLEDEL